MLPGNNTIAESSNKLDNSDQAPSPYAGDENETALVTGANRGIGLAIAAGLNRLGEMKVLVGSRRAEDGENAARTLGRNAVAVQLDMSNAEDLRRQVKKIVDAHGAIEILVNNAGVLEHGNILEIDSDRLNHSLQVNFLAPLELIRELVPGMKARGYGLIVNELAHNNQRTELLSG